VQTWEAEAENGFKEAVFGLVFFLNKRKVIAALLKNSFNIQKL